MLGIELKNRVAIVTGCSSGIGTGIAKMLARAGCHVSGCGIEPENPQISNLKSFFESHGVRFLYRNVDLTNDDSLKLFINETLKKFERIDFLISNAGKNYFTGIEDCSDADFEANIKLNLRAHWKISQICKPYLEKSDQATIIVIVSNHAYSTIPGCFPYNIAKTALKGLVQSLAIELAPKIRAVGVAPGFVETEATKKWFLSFSNPDKKRHETYALHPSGRIATPEEVGAFCSFLCCDFAKFLNGTTYLMDGGRSALMQDTYSN